MRTLLPQSHFARTATLALTSLISTLPAQLPIQAQTALANEICISPGFGFVGGRTRTSDYALCDGAPNTPGQTELFWVPTLQRRSCSATTDLSATLTNNNIRMVNLLNIHPGRLLTFTGTGQGDVLVGSPGTSDRLVGGGGNDTYVVGGREASLIIGPNDTVFPVSSVTEVDRIKLGASAENIYINPGPGGQANPGTLTTPIPGSPAVSFTPRGASAIPPAMRPTARDCLASIPQPQHLALASSFPLLAWLPREAGTSSDQAPPALFAQSTSPPSPGSKAYSGCRLVMCAGEGDGSPNARLYRDAFPGAPTLEEFSLDAARADRVFIPDRDFTFQGQPINDYLRAHKSLKVLVVHRVAFAPPLVVSPARLQALREQSKGLAHVRSDEAPLIYFRQNGLLVFSRNGKPLGSKANPGQIIAQLLDKRGRPLALPLAADQRYYEATFLEFLPTAPQRTDSPAGKS
jgi:hypothetical protein